MFAKEADALKKGDKVFTFNGVYRQEGTVLNVRKDHRGVRWIDYFWVNPKGDRLEGCKRHNSVYLGAAGAARY